MVLLALRVKLGCAINFGLQVKRGILWLKRVLNVSQDILLDAFGPRVVAVILSSVIGSS